MAPDASAGVPTERIRAFVERVYVLVSAPESAEGGPGARPAAVRKAVDEMFDWTEMAKQSLGRHWPERTPAERAEFVRLFADLFERAYLSKIQLADAEKFHYLGDTIEGERAVVRTKVTTKQGSGIAVDYRARLERGTQWRVYDLDIEGVSLVGNYRVQFNRIITRSSYEGLVGMLKASAGR